MSVNSKAASAPQIKPFAESEQVSQATQFAQFTLLDEVPELIFGLTSVVYIVSWLWARSRNPKPPGGHAHRPAFLATTPVASL